MAEKTEPSTRTTHQWNVKEAEASNDLALRMAVVDLMRLLRCMKDHEAPPDLSWQSIQGRANMAQDLWRHVQEYYRAAVYTDETMRQHDEERYADLERQVDHACRRAREIAAERKGTQVDIIQDIFFPEKSRESNVGGEEEKKDTSAEEHHEDGLESLAASDQHEPVHEQKTPSQVRTSTTQDLQELQKVQREQLEEEIAHMASRLKESTQNMNTTLRTQTEELGAMEDLATSNVEKVSSVASNVTEHNRKSWKSTLATWTIVFTVLGSFLFCMMIIRMVPKQRNKCLFFCGVEKEVCNRLDDGSVVCVDDKGNPYVRTTAPISDRLDGEEERDVQQCDDGNIGECKGELHDCTEQETVGASNDEPDDARLGDGECEAHYKSKESDCSNGHIGEYEAKSAETEPQEIVRSSTEDEEHLEALRQVAEATSAGNVSSPELIAEHEVASGSMSPHEGVNDDQVTEETAKAMEVDESISSESTESSGEPSEEPIWHVQNGHVPDDIPHEQRLQGPQPSNNSPWMEASRESSFKPAEIAAQYEHLPLNAEDADMRKILDGDGAHVPDTQMDFTAEDVRLQAHFGNNQLLRRYLYLMPQFASSSDENGWQAIHEAAAVGNVDTLELLLDNYHVDINARTGLVSDGVTPLYLAYRKGYDESSEVARFITSRGGISIGPGDRAPYKLLSEHTPEELEQYNLRDFHLAAARGDDVRVAQYVVARPDLVEGKDENGWRALHEAVRYGHLVTTQLLVNAGADINARTAKHNDGWSPLALAIQRFGEDHVVTRFLRKHNAHAHHPR